MPIEEIEQYECIHQVKLAEPCKLCSGKIDWSDVKKDIRKIIWLLVGGGFLIVILLALVA